MKNHKSNKVSIARDENKKSEQKTQPDTSGKPMSTIYNDDDMGTQGQDQHMSARITTNYNQMDGDPLLTLNNNDGEITERQLIAAQDFRIDAQDRQLKKVQARHGEAEVSKKKKKKRKNCCFLWNDLEEKIDKNLDQIVEGLSDKMASQQRAEENWAKVRRMKSRLIGIGMMKDLMFVNKQVHEDKNSQKKPFRYIIKPDNLYKMQFDTIVTLTYLLSLVLIPFVIAFHIEPLKHIRWLEFAIDWIIFLNIISVFFTAQIQDSNLVLSPLRIARQYIFSYFLIDLLSVIPGIVTAEEVKWVYYFKVLRYLQNSRLFSWISFILKKLRQQFPDNLEKIDNFNVFFQTLVYFLIAFHLCSCIWVIIGDQPGGWRTYLNEEDANSWLFVYVTSLYFVITTASTVGYGDYGGKNSPEKLYMIFLEFIGICSFSLITGNIAGLKRKIEIKEIIQQKQDDIENYLYMIDKQIEKDLEVEIYDTSKEYIKISYLNGVAKQLREGDFYKSLSPRLKNELILDALDPYYEKFQYFFRDVEHKQYADPVFIRKILSRLDCQIFLPQANIIEEGEIVSRLYFCYKGSVIVTAKSKESQFLKNFLSGVKATKGEEDENQEKNDQQDSKLTYITVLPERSFFGDYQILFNLPSNFNFTSFLENETWCMTISEKKFLEICEQFPQFHGFLCQRALLRRNHFKRIELNIINASKRQILSDIQKKNSTMVIINKSKEKRELLTKELMQLSKVEMPKFRSDQDQMTMNFTIPIMRQYLQAQAQITDASTSYLKLRFKKYHDFFEFQKNVIRGDNPNDVLKQFTIYQKSKKHVSSKQPLANTPDKKASSKIKQQPSETDNLINQLRTSEDMNNQDLKLAQKSKSSIDGWIQQQYESEIKKSDKTL